MIGTKTKTSVLNTSLFLRDVYLLLTMMLADKEVNKMSEIRDIVSDNYENEVNRLLVLTAVLARQMMESRKSNMGNLDCGDFRDETGQATVGKVTFMKACNSIIHAKEIAPYDIIPGKNILKRERHEGVYYEGVITVRCEHKKHPVYAKIDGQKYAKYCIMLGKEYLKKES